MLWHGVVVSGKQYREVVSREYHRNVLYPLKGRGMAEVERIYFSITENFNVVVSDGDGDTLEWISKGYLLDLRNIEFENVSSFSTYVFNLLNSKTERIRRCNLLRDTIFNRMIASFRNCGPEMETLGRPMLASKASEHVGLFSKGLYFDRMGKSDSGKWEMMNDDFYQLYRKTLKNIIDEGQRKLYFLMLGFALDRDIVYVGSSPGVGTQQALIDIGYKRKIWSFDPRPIVPRHGLNIEHISKEVHTAMDIESVVTRSYDLVWDVRGDYVDDEQYKRMVQDEIFELNSIIRSLVRVKRMSLKISCMFIDQYRLPLGGRFLPQPFCLDRKVSELRYYCRKGITEKISDPCIQSILLWKNDVKMEILRYSNYELSYNMLLGRFDFGNYMHMPRLTDTRCDLNLFTINRNDIESMTSYFDEDFPKIVSHLAKDYLDNGEYPLDETKILDLERHSVTRPRGFIGVEIPGLRIIIPKCLGIASDEYVHNDGQIIKSEYKRLMEKITQKEYDETRMRAASRLGKRFVRFPETFSIFDPLCSVSGHFLRVTHASVNGYVSEFSYADKIIYNFMKFSNPKSLELFEKDLFREIFDRGGLFEGGTIESSMDNFWHSKDEWIAGYYAGCELAKKDPVERFISSLNNILTIEKEGEETFSWKKRHHVTILTSSLNKAAKKKDYSPLVDHSHYGDFAKMIFELYDPQCRLNHDGRDLISTSKTKPEIYLISMKYLRFDAYVRQVYIRASIVELISKGKFENYGFDRMSWAEGIIQSVELLDKTSRHLPAMRTFREKWLRECDETLASFSEWSLSQKEGFLCYLMAQQWAKRKDVFWSPYHDRSFLKRSELPDVSEEIFSELSEIYDRFWDPSDNFYLYDAKKIYHAYEVGNIEPP
nr:TPA_asm: VP2 [Aedes orbi-like virus]